MAAGSRVAVLRTMANASADSNTIEELRYVTFCSRSSSNARIAASHEEAMIRSFAASRSYGNEWKYEMPPMSAAPATKWSQSAKASIRSAGSRASPSMSRYRGWSS